VNREEALDSIKANVENENLIKSMLAAEAIMRALAKRFGEDEEEWGLTGLLHDIDAELTEGDMRNHSKLWPESWGLAKLLLMLFSLITRGMASLARRNWIRLCFVLPH